MKSTFLPKGVLALVLAIAGWNASAVELKTFEAIKRDFAGSGDLSYVVYVLNRCAALHLTAGLAISSSFEDSNAKRLLKSSEGYYELSSAVMEELDKNRSNKRTEAERRKSAMSAIEKIAKVYAERASKNYALSGNYFIDDPQLAFEVEKCGDQTKLIRQANNTD